MTGFIEDHWVRFNVLDNTYDTPDGTSVPAEIVDNVQCLLDVLNIAIIRDNQRKTAQQLKNGG